MKKYILLISIAFLSILALFFSYGQSMDINNVPCHRMSNGVTMGDCDPSKEFMDVSELDPVKSSTIIDIEDGGFYTISADKVSKKINGKEIMMYGYNGMVPGPTLRVEQNSTITIEFENNLDMNTTVHWHGLRQNIKDDGVPGISQDPISPGESFTYTLYFPDEGIYWYHPHIREDIQQDLGLAGNMLVKPIQNNYYNAVSREELLVLDDILMDEDGVVPFGEDYANFAIMGRFGNVMLTNGEEFYSLEAQAGDVVRFYITNVANARPFNFSIDGVQLKLIGGDIGKFEREEFIDSVIIAPAVRYIVEAYFPKEGKYTLKNINPHKEYNLGEVKVIGNAEKDLGESFQILKRNFKIEKDILQFSSYFEKNPDYELDLTIDMSGMMDMMSEMPCHSMGGIAMGDCTKEEKEEIEENAEAEHEEMTIEWEDEMNMGASGETIKWIIEDTKNKRQNMDINMKAEVGDAVKIRIFNDPKSMHPMQHPIHLHGQRFIVTHNNGEAVENKVWTDTILVPIGSTVDILVDVTNPGEWMMHCHIAEHLEAGMMTSFIVAEGN